MRYIFKDLAGISEELERRAVQEDQWAEKSASARDRQSALIRANAFREIAAMMAQSEVGK